MSEYVVNDSGERQEYASGMRRDTQEGKPDYTLIPSAILTRWAAHMTRGAAKYGRSNWELANSEDELLRFKASAFRHFIQWLDGEGDLDVAEDHAAAVFFNIAAAEYVKGRLRDVAQTASDVAAEMLSAEPVKLRRCCGGCDFEEPPAHVTCFTDGSRHGTAIFLVRDPDNAEAWRWFSQPKFTITGYPPAPWKDASWAAEGDVLTEVKVND